MHNECKRCVPEKEYCTQKANVCVSGKTRYRKFIENDSEKELQQQNANEMHQTMKNCNKPIN